MNFQTFSKESGFKILAMAGLTDCEYSVVLYLINCAISGLSHLVTNEPELASLMGYDEEELRQALYDLADKNIIDLKYTDGQPTDSQSLRVGMRFDTDQWVLNTERELTSHDAVVFPFRRAGPANLQLYNTEKEPTESSTSTHQRIVNSFAHGRILEENEVNLAGESAKVLAATHPVDQVLLILRHFGGRIPTLSLLASSWQHYQDVFESETQKVDILGARQKHDELDRKLRDRAETCLERADEFDLTDEEENVLRILSRHRHPRRQLFWAYQSRARYPQLSAFFSDNYELMLPVTSAGTVVKKNGKPPLD